MRVDFHSYEPLLAKHTQYRFKRQPPFQICSLADWKFFLGDLNSMDRNKQQINKVLKIQFILSVIYRTIPPKKNPNVSKY